MTSWQWRNNLGDLNVEVNAIEWRFCVNFFDGSDGNWMTFNGFLGNVIAGGITGGFF
jgi:hypothetical protein